MPDVFVSHSSQDYDTTLRLCRDLETSGLTCWIAQRDIHAAETFQSAIVGAVKASAVTLPVFSDNANTSHDVLTELTLARKYKKPIVPVRIEKVEPVDSFEYYLAVPQWTDLFADWTGGIDRLTTALRRVVGDRNHSPGPSSASPWPLRRGALIIRWCLPAPPAKTPSHAPAAPRSRALHPDRVPLGGVRLPMRKPPTGEPCAGKPPARFGGRGGQKPFPTPIEGVDESLRRLVDMKRAYHTETCP